MNQIELLTREENEKIIQEGLSSFIEVGNALLRIREGKQYLSTHPTFDLYCRGVWGMTENYANKQILGAAVSTIVPVVNEAQARELVPLLSQPEKLKEVFSAVTATAEKTTAQKIKEAVQKVKPKKEKKSSAPSTAAQSRLAELESIYKWYMKGGGSLLLSLSEKERVRWDSLLKALNVPYPINGGTQ